MTAALYELPDGLVARDFDITPDGREIIIDRLEERADVELIERTHSAAATRAQTRELADLWRFQ